MPDQTPRTDASNLRSLWEEALLSYDPPDPIPAGGWSRLLPGADESDRIFASFIRALRDDPELRELGDQWFEGVGPGPWTPENRAGGPITLHNSNGDFLFVYSDDAARLINRLARAYREDSNA